MAAVGIDLVDDEQGVDRGDETVVVHIQGVFRIAGEEAAAGARARRDRRVKIGQ